MTGFDVAVGAILLISALVGFVRGATREVVTVVAFVAAVVVSIFALRFSAPVARHFIHTVWLAHVAALIAVFVIAYVIVRLIGGRLTRGVRQTSLSGLDRLLGFAIGLARGVVAVGLVVLLIRAATPPERMPRWFTHARTYHLANMAGSALRALGPRGMEMARHVAPAVENALAPEEPDADSGDNQSGATSRPGAHRGYTDKQRKALDDLVEKSR